MPRDPKPSFKIISILATNPPECSLKVSPSTTTKTTQSTKPSAAPSIPGPGTTGRDRPTNTTNSEKSTKDPPKISWGLSMVNANFGDLEAMVILRDRYKGGHGVNQDYKESLKYYCYASSQEHASAQYSLEFLYENGHGVKQNSCVALQWFLNSAEQGNSDAQVKVAKSYDTATIRDVSKARGHVAAQVYVGSLHSMGEVFPRDDAKALGLYLKAAKQGDKTGQFLAATAFEGGRGVAKNEAKAMKWHLRTAE
ncbi:hypothetical protein BGX24_000540 [Mortierella sp. AD032]|nr:hypothetical protein BGX24_000540 [Mortierella sp. AD032]